MIHNPRAKSSGVLDYLVICALVAVMGSAVVQGVKAQLPSTVASQSGAH